MQRNARMSKEIQMLETSPPHGISCWPKEDQMNELEACILGGVDTPYHGGTFMLNIKIPERYPFEPPSIIGICGGNITIWAVSKVFETPIYHPNIDEAGRICLDILKMPPMGNWKPCLNISTVLTSIQLLMSVPNPEDPLLADVAEEFKFNRQLFNKKAKENTEMHAKRQAKE